MEEKTSTFAERLTEALKMAGMTKAELSRRTGISKSSLTHWANGDWKASPEAVLKIGEVLGLPYGWLIGYGPSR